MCDNKRCPECGILMKVKTETYQSMADWDSDYEIYYNNYHYKCKDCKIECIVNNEVYCNKEKWIIPNSLRMSVKQSDTVDFINSKLRTDIKCYTKRQAWEFIGKNFEKAKNQQEVDFRCWCEDNQDWLPEYF